MKRTTQSVSFTKFTSTTNELSKTYRLVRNQIEKNALATMSEGTAERVTISFKNFAQALLEAASNQAFCYGLFEEKYPDEVEIVVKGKEKPKKNILSRSKEYFAYRNHPGILMLDHDPSEYGSKLSSDELIAILIDIDPQIENVAMIIRGSVSAGVNLAGRRPKRNKGFHIYIPVLDASQIPEYGKLLFQYLWLNGYGYIALSANGSLLVRSPIDLAVFSGERLDFVGKPIIDSKGLEYTEPKAEYFPGGYLDTSKLPALTPKQKNKVTSLIRKAKGEKKPDSDIKRNEYTDNKINQTIRKTGISREDATVLIHKIMDGKSEKLWGEYILEFPEGKVTVSEVLKNPNKYDGKALADPIEGRAYGITTAKFWFNNGNPKIRSFAHGQDKVYSLYEKEEKKSIVGVKPHYKRPRYITKDVAHKKMDRVAEKWIQNPKGHLAIAAPAGIGKTQIILKHVASAAKTEFIEIYVPTHQLATEVMDKLLIINPKLRVVVLKGRTHVDPKNGSLCKKSELISSIQKYGYNIYQDVCLGCEFFSPPFQCDYLKQCDDSTQVLILTHTHLHLNRNLDKKMPDMAIIDERFFTDMIDIQKIEPDLIAKYLQRKSLRPLRNVIVDSLTNGEHLLTELRNKFGGKVISVLEDAATKVAPHLPEISSSIKVQDLKREISNSEIKTRQLLVMMLNQLKAEMDKFPARENSVTVRLVKDKVVIVKRHELNRFTEASKEGASFVPVLCIDADYREEVAEVFLPGIKNIKLSVERNAYVTQIKSTTNAKSRFIPRTNTKKVKELEAANTHIKKVQTIINNVSEHYGNTLVVSYQHLVGNKKNGFKSILIFRKESKAKHFGALRGLNTFEGLNTVIIIGRNQMPIDAVESQAAAMWWDSCEELVLTGEPYYENRGFRLKDTNNKRGVKVLVCKDHRAQMLLELQRECETLQAIDRLRLIHNIEVKNVFILCNLPLDITVDYLTSFKALVTWKTAIEKALMRAPHEILPLGSDYLVSRYPDLFTNESMVKNKVGAAGLAQSITNIKKTTNHLVFNGEEYNLIGFRLEGGRGKNMKAIAPIDMKFSIVKEHLKEIFQKDVEICEYIKRGMANVTSIINDVDYEYERYYHLPLQYDLVNDFWYVVVDEE